MKRNKLVSAKGFTLVEISISIIIIGLLIAGLTSAAGMIKSAKIRKVIGEYEQYKTAIQTFKTQYNAPPGDMLNASSYWPTASNGNGNGYIDAMSSMTESVLAWRHLSFAHLVAESYTGTHTGNVTVVGTNVPKSAYTSPSGIASGWVYDNSRTYAHYYGVVEKEYLVHATSVGVAFHNNQSMSGADAYSIDQKIDDGIASTGIVLSARGLPLDATASRCVDQAVAYTAGPVNYVPSDIQDSCRVDFRM